MVRTDYLLFRKHDPATFCLWVSSTVTGVDLRDLTRGASAQQRVLAAVHRRFRSLGGAPSYRELSTDTGIGVSDIRRVLKRLEQDGLLHCSPGPRSIKLVRRGAMLSDTEVALEAAARGATIHWPIAPAAPLAAAYPLDDQQTDCPLDLAALLGEIDARMEDRHDPAEDQGKDGGAAGGQAPANDPGDSRHGGPTRASA